MPNHDTNYVCIAGSPAEVRRFRKEACQRDAKSGLNMPNFDVLAPQPDYVLDSTKHLSSDPAWYAWRIRHWGTKWEPYEPIMDEVKDLTDDISVMYMVFHTAWSPPTPIFEAIEQQYDLRVWAETVDEGGFEQPSYRGSKYGYPVRKREIAEYDDEEVEYALEQEREDEQSKINSYKYVQNDEEGMM